MDLLQKELAERPTAERAIRSLGEAVGLSRSTIFRHLHSPGTCSDDVEMRAQIQSVALEMRSYGYRPITAELHRRGVKGYVTFNTLLFSNELEEAEKAYEHARVVYRKLVSESSVD